MIRDKPGQGSSVLKIALIIVIVFFGSIAMLGMRSDMNHMPDPRPPIVPTVTPAFPGAVGYGAIAFADTNTALAISASGSPSSLGNRASDCRSLPIVVHFVTNMNDAGPGSFRDIVVNQVSSMKFDFVLFKTGGTVFTESDIQITAACVYIAGQTAPGGGVQFTHSSYRADRTTLRIDSGHVVLRYVRLRNNARIASGDPHGTNLSLNYGDARIVDHISTCCSIDKELFTGGYLPDRWNDDISLTNNIFFWSQGAGVGGGAGLGTDAPPTGGYTYYRNLLGGGGYRNPVYGTLWNTQFTNNVIYHWASRLGRFQIDTDGWNVGANRSAIDNQRNYSKHGDQYDNASMLSLCNAGTYGPCFTYHSTDSDLAPGIPLIYTSGNAHTNAKWLVGGDIDTVNFTRVQYRDQRSNWAALPDSTFRSASVLHKPPRFDIDTTSWSAAMAFDSVLALAGATHKLDDVNCDGTWTWNRDWIDSAFVQSVRDSIVQAPTDPTYCSECGPGDTIASAWAEWWATKRVGAVDTVIRGLPLLAAGTPCADGDDDGMPDVYEAMYSMNPAQWDANANSDGDLWFAIEEYLNGSNPDVFTNFDGSEGVTSTWGNGRIVFKTVFQLYGDASFQYILPDTSIFRVGVGAIPYGLIPKDLSSVAGDTVLVYTDLDIAGATGFKLDSLGFTVVEAGWNQCASRGICEDSVKIVSVP